jgi:signal transduction histidine kinase
MPSAPRAWFTDVIAVAMAIAVNSALVGAAASQSPADFPDIWTTGHLAGAVLALVLTLRRFLPLTTLVALVLGGFVGDVTGLFLWGVVGPGTAVAAYSVGRYLPLARALAGLAAGVVLDLVVTVGAPVFPEGFQLNGAQWMTYLVYLGWIMASWWVGRLVRMRAFHVAELSARAERLERARDAHARAALAEERSRIARELHDVVAHHVSVMTVQATAGRRVIDRSPERARQTLVEIEETGRQALSEMRRIVGVLRAAESGDPDRDPQPGLEGLADLVRQVTETGIPVELSTEGRPPVLPPGLDLTLYRVVQESLTNVLKHAGEGASAVVTLRFEASAVDVAVEDDGAGPDPDRLAADEPGHGLLGMRERVALFGGRLHAGPRPGGGFEVRARLPLRPPV